MKTIHQRNLALVVTLFANILGLQAETVLLRSGAKITAPILHRDERGVLLDIGHDFLRIPSESIVSISSDDKHDHPADVVSVNRLYMVSEHGILSTSDAVKRFAPSVVMVRTPRGLGSGFFVNREGYIVTNFHVIAGSQRIAVTRFVPGATGFRQIVHRDVEILAAAPFYDLAVLRLTETIEDIAPAVFPPADETTAGERIFVIGNPLGLEQTVTEGVVSQAHRHHRGVLYRQIDAPVNPGNSGGPLFNARGQVIGVINAKIPFMDGLGFAIPAMHVKYVLDHIDAFAFNAANSEFGFVYPDPPPLPKDNTPPAKERYEK